MVASTDTPVTLWIRAEVKPKEFRTSLTPDVCKRLIEDEGYKIYVEKWSERCLPDEEYEKVGCQIVDAGTWKTEAPEGAYVVGLKELPEEDTPITQKHIFFAHCFKGQDGWKDILGRFARGNGTILDLEFLTDDKGRRVAAFGYMAGFCGMALGLLEWAHKCMNPGVEFPKVVPYPNEDVLIGEVKKRLDEVKQAYPDKGLPRVLVIGALGRCGTGACDFAVKAGLPEENISRWDMEETKAGGPFVDIAKHDLFVNCIYLTTKIPPFIDLDTIRNTAGRKLQTVVDVSCDPNNPNNPVPIYNAITFFDSPTTKVDVADPPLTVIAIDHLPSLLPLESSQRFSQDLEETMKDLKNFDDSPVWQRAIKLFNEKKAEL
eukprot:Clim_evm33s55 gene=Clim_evmTU33s55